MKNVVEKVKDAKDVYDKVKLNTPKKTKQRTKITTIAKTHFLN